MPGKNVPDKCQQEELPAKTNRRSTGLKAEKTSPGLFKEGQEASMPGAKEARR